MGAPVTVGGEPSGPAHLTAASLPLRNIATIAVFYALPVVQLVITYQTVRATVWDSAPTHEARLLQ